MALQVIFDMDGVLFDTERLCLRVWRELAPEFGVTEETITRVFYDCVGTTQQRTAQIICEHCGADFPFADYRVCSSARFREIVAEEGLPVLPGARRLLGWLRTRGARIGLASSTRRAVVEEELRQAGLLRYFDAVVGGDELPHSKPAPDIYLAACRALHVRPADTFAVEDSHNGIRAAARAGMRPLMVPDLLPATAEMRQLSTAVLPSLFAVLTYLEGQPW